MTPSETESGAIGAGLRQQLSQRCSQDARYPTETFAGSGIVICAGGAAIFTNAYVLIHVLRNELGCTLPIEVWHFGASELSDRMKALLRSLDADPVDADVVIAAKGVAIVDGWQLKSLALMWSRFERVLLLDADVVPEIDPTPLLQWPEFLETGAVLWPDICSILRENPIWEACGLEPRQMRAVESGQLLVDKSRHWRALGIILFLNEHAAHYYRMVYGDKDLFLLGLLLAHEPYAMVPHLPISDQPWCLFQRDFAGDRLFQHRTGAKWRYQSPQEHVPAFRHLEACEAALSALRRGWNGKIFNPPPRSQRARDEEKRLARLPAMTLELSKGDRVPFQLLDGGDIGRGRSTRLQNWYCTDGDPFEIVIDGSFGPRRLRGPVDGRWVETGDTNPPSVLKEGAAVDDREATSPHVFEFLRAAGYPSPVWRDRVHDLRAAFGLLAIIDPLTTITLLAAADRRAETDPDGAALLRSIAADLPGDRAVAEIVRPKWEPVGRYRFDDEPL